MTNVRVWRGTNLPTEYVDGRVYYLYDDDSMTTFTMYVDHDGRRSKISSDLRYSRFLLSKDDWTGTANEGGRSWATQELTVAKCYTHTIVAYPCGNTVEDMATEEQEKIVSLMKGFMDEDAMKLVFYVPSDSIPTIDIPIAVEGVE